jgi:hypothetical protein
LNDSLLKVEGQLIIQFVLQLGGDDLCFTGQPQELGVAILP